MSLYDDDRPMIWRELAKDLTPLPKIKKRLCEADMNDKLWVIEIDNGAINWTPIAYSESEAQASKLAAAPHIVSFGKPVRVREFGGWRVR